MSSHILLEGHQKFNWSLKRRCSTTNQEHVLTMQSHQIIDQSTQTLVCNSEKDSQTSDSVERYCVLPSLFNHENLLLYPIYWQWILCSYTWLLINLEQSWIQPSKTQRSVRMPEQFGNFIQWPVSEKLIRGLLPNVIVRKHIRRQLPVYRTNLKSWTDHTSSADVRYPYPHLLFKLPVFVFLQLVTQPREQHTILLHIEDVDLFVKKSAGGAMSFFVILKTRRFHLLEVNLCIKDFFLLAIQNNTRYFSPYSQRHVREVSIRSVADVDANT